MSSLLFQFVRQTDKERGVGDKYRESPILPDTQMDKRLRSIIRKAVV